MFFPGIWVTINTSKRTKVSVLTLRSLAHKGDCEEGKKENLWIDLSAIGQTMVYLYI